MKLSKLLERLSRFLDAPERERHEQRKELSETLKKLKKKSLQLEQEIAECRDPQQQQDLEEKLAILQNKRRKGVALAKELKQLHGSDPA